MLEAASKRISLAMRALRYGDKKPEREEASIRISDDEIREAKHFFPMQKFFIFGHARSGTTLFARLIRVHPDVHCNWQGHFFTRPPFLSSLVSDAEVSEWLSRKNNRWNRGQDLSPVVLRTASDFILEREAVKAGKSVVGDKSPNNLVNGEAVHRLANIYPDAKLIFIVRDGRDAVLSHQIQKFIDLPDQLNSEESAIRHLIINDPRKFLAEGRSIFSRSGLSKSAQAWVDNVSETNQLGMKIYSENFLSLRFENLVENPVPSLEKAWNLLGVHLDLPGLNDSIEQELTQNPDADWQREKQQRVAGIIRKGLPGSWRDIFTAEDVRTFKEIAGDILIEWDYEDDLEW